MFQLLIGNLRPRASAFLRLLEFLYKPVFSIHLCQFLAVEKTTMRYSLTNKSVTRVVVEKQTNRHFTIRALAFTGFVLYTTMQIERMD